MYKRKDHFYTKAKKEGYRSRAAYKLMEIQNKYRIIKPGNQILDIGCAPGSWLEVVKIITKSRGTMVGVDLLPLDPIDGVHLISGDIHDQVVHQKIIAIRESFDLLLCDAAPNLSGNKITDQHNHYRLIKAVLDFSHSVLKPGGKLLCKVFQSPQLKELTAQFRQAFNQNKIIKLDSTRKSSAEMYLLGLGWKGS